MRGAALLADARFILKPEIAVDTDGRLLMVDLASADISDSADAQLILDAIRKRGSWVKHCFADGADDRGRLMDKACFLDCVVEGRPPHRPRARRQGPALPLGR